MRILEEEQEVVFNCPECNCRFAYDDDDIYNTIYGDAVMCPKCGEDVIIHKHDRLGQFPDAWFHFGQSKNSKIVSPEEIEKAVKCGLRYMIEHNEDRWSSACGNMRLDIDDYGEDGFDINCSVGYYNLNISREEVYELLK